MFGTRHILVYVCNDGSVAYRIELIMARSCKLYINARSVCGSIVGARLLVINCKRALCELARIFINYICDLYGACFFFFFFGNMNAHHSTFCPQLPQQKCVFFTNCTAYNALHYYIRFYTDKKWMCDKIFLIVYFLLKTLIKSKCIIKCWFNWTKRTQELRCCWYYTTHSNALVFVKGKRKLL